MRLSLLVLVAGLMLADWQTAHAQVSQGAFGARSSGSGSSNRSRTFSGRTSGQQLNLPGAQGMGMGSGTGMGRSTAGGRGGANSTSAFSRGSTDRQANQFVGSDANELQRFVGALSGSNAAGGRGNVGMSGRTMMGNRGMGAQMFGDQLDQLQLDNQGNDPRSQRARMRIRTTIGFQHPPMASSPQMSAALTGRLVKLLKSRTGFDVLVELTGRTAILRGTVPTVHDAIVAEQLLRLEPGVGQVQNDLAVVGQSSAEPIPPVVAPSLSAPAVVAPPAAVTPVLPQPVIVAPSAVTPVLVAPPAGIPSFVVPPAAIPPAVILPGATPVVVPRGTAPAPVVVPAVPF